MLPYEIIDLRPLYIRGTMVASSEPRVTASRPRLADPSRQILRVNSKVQRASCIAPDLPRRSRRLQPLQKPCLLLRAQNRLRRLILAEVRHALVAIRDEVRRLPAVVQTPGIQNLHSFLRKQLRKVRTGEGLRFRPVGGILRPIAPLVCEDQIDVGAPAHGPVPSETADGGQVVRLLPKSMLVKP